MYRLALLTLFLCGLAPATDLADTFFTNVQQADPRRLENAEAYWSPDGKRLIFQSTRGDSKCDQIYIMNADGSNQHMVSTGKGRTTCGYFLPDNKHILYASTHLAEPRLPARSRSQQRLRLGRLSRLRHLRREG